MSINIFELLRQVTAGDASAIQLLLQQYKEHALTPADEEEVQLYLRQAVNKSHHAIYFRALLYQYGYGVAKNVDMAFLLMREAASKGNAKALYAIGHYYLHGISVEKNYENALQWLTLAANSPNYDVEAMEELAMMYEQGLGVGIDVAKAEEWRAQARDLSAGSRNSQE